MGKGASIQNAAQSDAERHRDVTPHWASVPASIRHFGQEVLQGAYRRHVFKKNMALRFDALADAIAIFTVPDEFDRKRSEERRVGKECRSGWARSYERKKER